MTDTLNRIIFLITHMTLNHSLESCIVYLKKTDLAIISSSYYAMFDHIGTVMIEMQSHLKRVEI